MLQGDAEIASGVGKGSNSADEEPAASAHAQAETIGKLSKQSQKQSTRDSSQKPNEDLKRKTPQLCRASQGKKGKSVPRSTPVVTQDTKHKTKQPQKRDQHVQEHETPASS